MATGRQVAITRSSSARSCSADALRNALELTHRTGRCSKASCCGAPAEVIEAKKTVRVKAPKRGPEIAKTIVARSNSALVQAWGVLKGGSVNHRPVPENS